jgi:hypothetical protein
MNKKIKSIINIVDNQVECGKVVGKTVSWDGKSFKISKQNPSQRSDWCV